MMDWRAAALGVLHKLETDETQAAGVRRLAAETRESMEAEEPHAKLAGYIKWLGDGAELLTPEQLQGMDNLARWIEATSNDVATQRTLERYRMLAVERAGQIEVAREQRDQSRVIAEANKLEAEQWQKQCEALEERVKEWREEDCEDGGDCSHCPERSEIL